MGTTTLQLNRCGWAENDPLMQAYHDEEWGVALHDDRKLFEYLILDGAQAGLSWRTILYRREGYRQAFAGFDPRRVAQFGPQDVRRLLKDPGIIRNRLKIKSAIQNARAFLEVQAKFKTFDRYIWQFVEGKRIRRDEQGSSRPRVQLRRLDDLLRLHASRRDGRRPPCRLLPQGRLNGSLTPGRARNKLAAHAGWSKMKG